MKLEHNSSGYVRCWLSDDETDKLVNYYEDDPEKQLSIRLMVQSGLRISEVTSISKSDIESTDADYNLLTVKDSKTGSRQTVATTETVNLIRAISSIRDNVSPTDPVITSSKRTIQNWVSKACEALESEDEPNWSHVSAHDLRRTWATSMVHKGLPSDLIMDWGGWQHHSTFRDHYYSLSDQQVAEQLQDAGIV